MRILVLGSSGMLGSDIVREAQKNHVVIAPSRKELDILDFHKVEEYIKNGKFHFVINCTAYTNVDLAETESDTAFNVNYCAVMSLANACNFSGSRLIHFSTDYVFDGEKEDGVYKELDLTNPLQVYGKSKLDGESAAVFYKACVLRVQWLYGSSRSNFVSWMMERAINKNPTTIYDGQIGVPTATKDIADAVINYVLPRFESGVFHFSTSDIGVTKYHVGSLIYSKFTYADLIERTNEIPIGWKAKRPRNVVLNSDKFCVQFGYPKKGFSKSLQEFINEGSTSFKPSSL